MPLVNQGRGLPLQPSRESNRKMVRSNFDLILRGRINIVLLFFLTAFAALAGRLFILQIVYHKEYAELALKQHGIALEFFSKRGEIFAGDKNGNAIPLALNKTEKTLAVSPKDVKNPEELADTLQNLVGIQKEILLDKFSKKDDPHEILFKNIDLEIAEKIKGLNLEGIFLEEAGGRIYPQKSVGAHLVGFAGREKELFKTNI